MVAYAQIQKSAFTAMCAPNTRMHPTPLCGRKIAAILKVGFGPSAFPIYEGGAGDAQPVGRAAVGAKTQPANTSKSHPAESAVFSRNRPARRNVQEPFLLVSEE